MTRNRGPALMAAPSGSYFPLDVGWGNATRRAPVMDIRMLSVGKTDDNYKSNTAGRGVS